MSEEFANLELLNKETFVNLQDHEVYDLCRMYYYFKLTQTIVGKTPVLTHFQISCGALLVKIAKKTPPSHLASMMEEFQQLRDFMTHEVLHVIEFIRENGTEKDKEEYL